LPDLLDANIWIALSVADHTFHARSVRYIETEASDRLAFCRMTELALLRLLSNAKALGDVALDGGGAWATLQGLIASPRVVRLEEPMMLDEVLGAWAADIDVRGKHWSDAYLAAFAVASKSRLVTFDSDFKRYSGLSYLLLSA
jgi:toxin-antitoxin system PIN domain toxin